MNFYNLLVVFVEYLRSASPACLRCSGTGRLQSSVTLDSEIRGPFIPGGDGSCFHSHSFTSHTY
jgi:hypothetical protein